MSKPHDPGPQDHMEPRYHLVVFMSEGPPYDRANDLMTPNREPLLRNAGPHFDRIEIYTPRRLREMGYEPYVREYEKSGLVSCNPGLQYIGFCAWRPLIMLLELERMEPGDILVYRDCNLQKYPELADYRDIRSIIRKCLELCEYDLFIPRDVNYIPLKRHVKTNVIRELGRDDPFVYNFSLLLSGLLLVARKSDQSVDLLTEWKQGCENHEWINGEQYGKLYPFFRWSTPEQGILATIIANRIRDQRLPPTYPPVYFRFRKIRDIQMVRYRPYLRHLKK